MLIELYIAYHSIDFIEILDVQSRGPSSAMKIHETDEDEGPRDRNIQDLDEIYAMISYI